MLAGFVALGGILPAGSGCAARSQARNRPSVAREKPAPPATLPSKRVDRTREGGDEEPRTEEVALPGQNRSMPSQDRRDGSAPPQGVPDSQGAPDSRAASETLPEPPAAQPPTPATDASAERTRFDPPTLAPGERRYRVQVLAATRAVAAYAMREEVERSLAHPVYLEQEAGIWKVRVGDFADREEAEGMRRRLHGIGYSDAFLVEVKGR